MRPLEEAISTSVHPVLSGLVSNLYKINNISTGMLGSMIKPSIPPGDYILDVEWPSTPSTTVSIRNACVMADAAEKGGGALGIITEQAIC